MTRSQCLIPTLPRHSKVWLVLWALNACTPQPPSALARAEFGVLFGGQYQERLEVPFELDATKQTLGFIVQLKEPSSAPLPVHWEVAKPGPPNNGLSNALSRRTELFDKVLPAGQLEFAQPVVLNPGDQLGTWNIRVLVGNHIAIDRPFWVFDPELRARAFRGDAGPE